MTNGEDRRISRRERDARIFSWVGFIVILLAALTTFWFFYMVLFPKPVNHFSPTSNLPVGHSIVDAGSFQEVQLKYCKTRDLDSNITVALQDGALTTTFSSIQQLPLGCHTMSLSLPILSDTKPDKYQFIIEVTYHNGSFLHDESHELRTQQFEVVAPPKNQTVINQLIQACQSSMSNTASASLAPGETLNTSSPTVTMSAPVPSGNSPQNPSTSKAQSSSNSGGSVMAPQPSPQPVIPPAPAQPSLFQNVNNLVMNLLREVVD